MQPRFSQDFTKLTYFGSETKFLSHTGNYQLKMLSWPQQQHSPPEIVIDKIRDYPSDDQEFAGLYGFGNTFTKARFIEDSSKFFLFCSEFKGQRRIYVVDTISKEVKMLRIPGLTEEVNLRRGDYILMRAQEDCLIVEYSTPSQPSQIYLIRIKQVLDEG